MTSFAHLTFVSVDVYTYCTNRLRSDTPLVLAARGGHVGVVELLLNDARTEIDHNRHEPLQDAAENGHIDVVKLMLGHHRVHSHKVCCSQSLQNVVYNATRRRHANVVDCLLNDERIRADTDLERVLLAAAHDGCADIVKLVLSLGGAELDVNTVGSHGTPIHVAVTHTHLDIFKILIDHDRVNVDTPDVDSTMTPLLEASSRGCVEMVQTLMRHPCVDVNYRACGGKGDTGLIAAARHGHVDIVVLYLNNEKFARNVNASDADRCDTALHEACKYGHVDTVRVLIADGRIDVNARNAKHDDTPAAVAARRDELDVLKTVMGNERVLGDIASCDKDGFTILHLAAFEHSVNVVRFLLHESRFDCMWNMRNYCGNTVIHVALINSYRYSRKLPEIMKMFLSDDRIDVSAQDNLGETPLMFAKRQGARDDTMKLLLQDPRIDATNRAATT